jgi:hypothetical protein
LTVLNQLFELEIKISGNSLPEHAQYLRHVSKIKDAMEEQGLFYENPCGQSYNETRTDVEASVAGGSTENLHVVQVIKPIIREGTRALSRVVQKGIVVVQSKQN